MSSSSTQEKKISLKTAEGVIFKVEEPVAMELKIVNSFFADNNDATEDMVVPLPNVYAKHLSPMLDYCRAHVEFRRRTPPPPEEEVMAFDAAFLENKNNDHLKEMILAANYLNIKELLDFLSDSAAKRIQNKSVEYVRNFFGIENDFTPEEEEKVRKEYEWTFEGIEED